MGIAVSRNLDLATNEYCLRFVGKESISQNDPFWNRFLAFNLTPPLTRNDQLVLDSKIEPLLQDFLKNNLISGNLNSLMQIFVTRSSELLVATDSDANLFNWQLFNTLFALRCVLKYLVEMVPEDQLFHHIEFNLDSLIFESFVRSLIEIIVDVPVQDSTYQIHLESVTCLLVLLSVQYHSGLRSDHSRVYNIIMRGRHLIHVPLFVKSLLNNFIQQKKAPPGYGDTQGSSIVIGLASELWSILTFNRQTESQLTSELTDYQNSPLGTQSILLLLVLVHNWTTLNNPYRNCLFSCSNQDNASAPQSNEAASFKIEFGALYETLCKKVGGDPSTLLLYLLLHRNATFRIYVLNKLDLQELIIPILRTLYNAPNSHSHHIYMSLIILLILSEDDTFNKTIHDTKLTNVTWYTERLLSEISLGGLLILVIIRTIQYNMLKMRDKYLHTNCLAALANMSSQFRDLHPYVSQRLVSLFETISKKYQKLSKRLNDNRNSKTSEVAIEVTQEHLDLEHDVNVFEEVIRMVLEIFNCCLANQLVNNPNLIYNLLYNKHVFEQFKDNVVFQDIIFNIEIVINYFSELLNEKKDVDANEVLQVIQRGGKYWPKDKLTKFPDLKFKYVEEEQPEEFFIPYVWELVNKDSILIWSSSNLANTTAIC